MTILYVVHFLITLFVIFLVLMQKSEGGASLVSGGAERIMSGSYASYNRMLSKLTVYGVIAFFSSSIIIASVLLSSNSVNLDKKALDVINQQQQTVEPLPAADAPLGE